MVWADAGTAIRLRLRNTLPINTAFRVFIEVLRFSPVEQVIRRSGREAAAESDVPDK
jgi:hypothetical protein